MLKTINVFLDSDIKGYKINVANRLPMGNKVRRLIIIVKFFTPLCQTCEILKTIRPGPDRIAAKSTAGRLAPQIKRQLFANYKKWLILSFRAIF